MEKFSESSVVKSTTDLVFDRLYEEIVSLDILPGSKMSEAEVGKRFGVSRQPVRDAFKRLDSLDLLDIKPQRATTVRLFSMNEIENTRFLRLAVELELIELACANWNATHARGIRTNLDAQMNALNTGDAEGFHRLDYVYHRLLCKVAGQPRAFEIIETCKRKVDRLCILSLAHNEGGAAVLNDHKTIIDAVEQGDVVDARALTRQHLNRLSGVIAEIYENHTDYFV